MIHWKLAISRKSIQDRVA